MHHLIINKRMEDQSFTKERGGGEGGVEERGREVEQAGRENFSVGNLESATH